MGSSGELLARPSPITVKFRGSQKTWFVSVGGVSSPVLAQATDDGMKHSDCHSEGTEIQEGQVHTVAMR